MPERPSDPNRRRTPSRTDGAAPRPTASTRTTRREGAKPAGRESVRREAAPRPSARGTTRPERTPSTRSPKGEAPSRPERPSDLGRRASSRTDAAPARPAASARSSRREPAKPAGRESVRRETAPKTNARGEAREGRTASTRSPKPEASPSRGSARLERDSSKRESRTGSSREGRGRTSRRDDNRQNTRSHRSKQQGKTAPKLLRGNRPFILAGAVLLLLIVGYIVNGVVHRAQLLRTLREGDAASRSVALEEYLNYGGSPSALLAGLMNLNAAEPWSEGGRADAAYGLLCLKRADIDTHLSTLAQEGEDPAAEATRALVLAAIPRAQAAPRFKPELFLEAAKSQTPAILHAALLGLGDYRGAPVVDTLLAHLQKGDPETSKIAGEALDKAATSGEAGLILPLLEAEAPRLCELGRRLLSNNFDEKTLHAIRIRLTTAGPKLARDLLTILGEHTNTNGAAEAIASALIHADVSVRCEALNLIGTKRLSRAYATAAKALADPDAGVRLAAVECFARSGSPDYCETVLPTLQDPSSGVRSAAIGALTRMGCFTTPFLAELIRLLDDETAVSTAAITALKQIKPRNAKLYGDNPTAWKEWWAVYHEQVAVVEELEKSLATTKKLGGEQTDAAYDKTKKLCDEVLAKAEALCKRKDLVPELAPGEPLRRRLELFENQLRIAEKWATKLRTSKD